MKHRHAHNGVPKEKKPPNTDGMAKNNKLPPPAIVLYVLRVCESMRGVYSYFFSTALLFLPTDRS